MRQLITLWYVTTNRKTCWIRTVIIGESVIKRLSLYEFSLRGREFVSIVFLRLFLQRMYGHFLGTKWTVHIREVSVRRGSTVLTKHYLWKIEPPKTFQNMVSTVYHTVAKQPLLPTKQWRTKYTELQISTWISFQHLAHQALDQICQKQERGNIKELTRYLKCTIHVSTWSSLIWVYI